MDGTPARLAPLLVPTFADRYMYVRFFKLRDNWFIDRRELRQGASHSTETESPKRLTILKINSEEVPLQMRLGPRTLDDSIPRPVLLPRIRGASQNRDHLGL